MKSRNKGGLRMLGRLRRKMVVLGTCIVGGLLVLGCSDQTDQPVLQEPQPPAIVRQAPPPLSKEAKLDLFCDELAKIIDAEKSGFVDFRFERKEERIWQSSANPLGLNRCEIEGRRHPAAIHTCFSQPIRGQQGVLDLAFLEMTRDIDQCLNRPIWFPRDWEKGDDFIFASGERQIMWRDTASYPRPAVILKVEEDFIGKSYYLRLEVRTLR